MFFLYVGLYALLYVYALFSSASSQVLSRERAVFLHFSFILSYICSFIHEYMFACPSFLRFCNHPLNHAHVHTLTHVLNIHLYRFNGRKIFEKTSLGGRLKEMMSFNRDGLYDFSWSMPGHLLRCCVEECPDGFMYVYVYIYVV